jgi:4-methyl-5(b-hydroxyethyl)-thiazole monophosphate biosynthesis
MKKAIIFLINGFEEMEAIVPGDILRRAGVEVMFMSVTDEIEITGSHDIKIISDRIFDENAEADMLILPGGPGASGYINNQNLIRILERQNNKNRHIAAICAAPVTLGKLGMLKDKKATCYPSMSDELGALEYIDLPVITDGNITTARAAGASAEFGIKLAEILVGTDKAQSVKTAMFIKG